MLLPARPLLLLLHLHADHRRLRLGSQGNGGGYTMLLRLPSQCRSSSIEGEWQRTDPRYRPWAHALFFALVRASRQDACESRRGVRWLDWPCGQNPGRKPEGRQRASSARDDGASANRIHVAGPVCSCQENYAVARTARARLSASDSRVSIVRSARRGETSEGSATRALTRMSPTPGRCGSSRRLARTARCEE